MAADTAFVFELQPMTLPIEYRVAEPVELPGGCEATTHEVWPMLSASRAGDLNAVRKMVEGCPGLVHAEYNYTPAILAKTLNSSNEPTQMRHAVAQLLEYRFRFGQGGELLAMVADGPISAMRKEFLGHLAIGFIYTDGMERTLKVSWLRLALRGAAFCGR